MMYQEELTIERPNSSPFGNINKEFIDKMLSSSMFYKNADWTSTDVPDIKRWYYEKYVNSLSSLKPIDSWDDEYIQRYSQQYSLPTGYSPSC